LLTCIYIVEYRLVAKRWLCKQRHLLGNARNIHACKNRRTAFSVVRDAAVSGQLLGKHVPAATDTNNRRTVFSTWSVPRWYKQGTTLVQSSVLYGRLWRKVLLARVRLWRDDFTCSDLKCVIQWDCYSSCVKIRRHETANGHCKRPRTLVCVSQWSVKCSHKSWVYKWSINRVANPNPVYSHSYTWQTLFGHCWSMSDWSLF
jgi:hypothetical protein